MKVYSARLARILLEMDKKILKIYLNYCFYNYY